MSKYNQFSTLKNTKEVLDKIELDLKKSVDKFSKETFYNDLKELSDFTEIDNIELYYRVFTSGTDLSLIPIMVIYGKIGKFVANRLISLFKIKKFEKMEKERLYKKALQMHQATIMMLKNKAGKIDRLEKDNEILVNIIKNLKNE